MTPDEMREATQVDSAASNAPADIAPLLARIRDQQRLLQQQNDELRRAEGLRQEFSANVSHEMKTPLQVISGYAEMMANGMVDPDDVPRFAGKIYAESQRLRALINDVLTLSRLDEPAAAVEHEPVDLAALAERIIERLAPVAQEAGVSVSLAGAGATVEGSAPLLEQAVSNLIENAIRYNHPGGSVEVEVGCEAAIASEASPSAEPRCASVQVRDTGLGIARADREKIFERFYRTDKSRSKETGGTGLGLAIVKHAALYHGGDVSVDSELGRGSTFTLRIPMR